MNHTFLKPDSKRSRHQPTLFLPGWGFDGSILKLLRPVPSWIYPANPLDPQSIGHDILQLITEEHCQKIRLIGWSLGAMLALDFAAEHRELVDSLVLISLRSHWPETDIKEIRKKFSRDPALFLEGFYRKCFLCDKQSYATFRHILEPVYLDQINENYTRLYQGLDMLAAFTMPAALIDLPITMIHGGQDIVAPLADMPTMAGAEIEIIKTAGHVPFLHRDCSLQRELKKLEIMLKFSKAADTYDGFAKVQAEVARKLASRLPTPLKSQGITTILEIGCGTGNFTAMLHSRYPKARITALDFSPAMVGIARRKLNSPDLEFICADGEAYLEQAAPKSFDLVLSNGSLQWFSDLNKTVHNISRILTAKGTMSCSIFGPASLRELGEGLESLLSRAESLAAQTFPGLAELEQIMAENFLESTVTEELIVKQYTSALDLLLHIKKTGTGGWQQNSNLPLTPARLKKLDAWFKAAYGSCRVTYQVFYLQGKTFK